MQTTRKEAIIHHLWAWRKPSYVQLVSYIITNQSWDVWFWVLAFSEGSLEVKFPTIWTDGKAEVGRVREEKNQKKEDSGARKGRQVAVHCVFPMICVSGRSKVGSLKRRVRSHLGRWGMNNCTMLRCEAHFQIKLHKTPSFGALLEVEISKKCTPLWCEAHFEVKI
jgi:hypothetical protein